MLAGLMGRSGADKIWQLWNFLHMEQTKQKFVMKKFVFLFCQDIFSFVCQCQKAPTDLLTVWNQD